MLEQSPSHVERELVARPSAPAATSRQAPTVEGFDGEAGGGAAGGAIYLAPGGAPTLRDATLRVSVTTSPGAVLSAPFLGGSTTRLTIESSTFEDCASMFGAVLDVRDAIVTLAESTLTGNQAAPRTR